ncbi:MAG: glycosyltransferase family 4 protein [Ferruginibacter sp.]
MKKIAFIVQQYGLEMYGGAELHCMRLAEKMASFYKVDVLTTCSLDFLTWANHYPEGESEINRVTVKRFKVSQLRDWGKMGVLEKKVKQERYTPDKRKGIKSIFKIIAAFIKKSATREDYINWVIAQGPTTPDLINYIKTKESDYDCLIFFSYLYYPTVFGIHIDPQKTIFIPLAHDEWALYMPVFKPMFRIPACIMYNTRAEKALVNRVFKNESVHSEIAGTWVNIPAELPDIDVKTTLKIYSDYILYVGRIDDFKITNQDFDWFLKYVDETKRNIKMILTGNLYRELPVNDHIMYLGFVDEHIKFNLIKQSLFLFQPSRFESLSIVVLEAFAMEKPVLVHQDCEVMKDHVDISEGGFYYKSYAGFKDAVNQLADNISLNNAMGKSGKAYVDENYSSEKIITKFQNVIENIIPDKN